MSQTKRWLRWLRYLDDWYVFVGHWTLVCVVFLSPVAFVLAVWLVPSFRIPALLYVAWLYCDRHTPHLGGRRYVPGHAYLVRDCPLALRVRSLIRRSLSTPVRNDIRSFAFVDRSIDPSIAIDQFEWGEKKVTIKLIG